MGNPSQEEDSSMPKIVCHPKNRETQLVRFQRFVEQKHKRKFKDFWELHAWSIEEFPDYWGDVWEFFGIKYSQPYSRVCCKNSTFENVQWFEGMLMNYTENIMKYRDSHIAIIATDDQDNAQYISYKDLYEEVRVYIRALKDAGVKMGDVLCCYISNKVEAVFAFLATAAIGGVWCGTLPLLGTKAVLSRFQLVNPKILFVGGNFFFEGTEIMMDKKIREIVQNLPCLCKVVYVPSKSENVVEDISDIPNCVFMSEFLKDARKELLADQSPPEYQQVPFDHPMTMSFTSGTTGSPKCLVHNNGIILASLKDYGLHKDITRNDVILNYSPVGWVTWNMIVGTMHMGTTICMYEGFPFQGQRFYEVVDKYGITTSFIWSSTVDEMETSKQIPGPHHSLKTLKQVYPMGSVTKPRCIEFLLQKVQPDMFSTSAYGTTESFGVLSGMDFNRPVYWGEIQMASLGVDIKILNSKGEPVIGERGDVVLGKPMPTNVMSVLNDPDGRIYKKQYLEHHPGYFNIGDDGSINPKTGGLYIYGRSDENLNPKGARFTCSEIYFALEGFPGIMDCVVTSHYNSKLDERVVLFVKLQPGHALTHEMVNAIKTTIEENMSVEHVPELVLETSDIPYNMNGKKLNLLVKKLVNKMCSPPVEVVVNPECLEFFHKIDLGDF